jgi:hypothetical protein
VKPKHENEAIHLLEVIKKDMLLYMTKEAARNTFMDYDTIKDEEHQPWEPYQQGQEYEEVKFIKVVQNDINHSNKRSKATNDESHNGYQNNSKPASYADALGQVLQNQNKATTKAITKINDDFKIEEDYVKNDEEFDKKVVLAVDARLSMIEQKNAAMEQQFKQLESNVTKEMQETNKNVQALNTRMDSVCTIEAMETNNDMNNRKLLESFMLMMDARDAAKEASGTTKIVIRNEHNKMDYSSTSEVYKRNLAGACRDENGYIPNDVNKENQQLGGNHNNCNNNTQGAPPSSLN